MRPACPILCDPQPAPSNIWPALRLQSRVKPALPMSPHVLLLLGVTAVWGTTFPLLKSLLTSLSGIEISALRFVIAALCMTPFLMRVPRHTWLDGLLLLSLIHISEPT